MFLPETNDREIILAHKDLTDENLASCLSGYQNQTVISLNLALNKLTLTVGDALRQFIQQQSISLKILILHNNKLGDEGTKTLASIINNSCIEELYLDLNSIRDEGTKALCEELKKNIYLKTLFISHNALGREAILAITDMLKVNKTLEYLSLECCELNKIEDVSQLLDELLDAAYKHPTLLGIEVNANHLPLGYYGKFADFYKSRHPDIFPTTTSNAPPPRGCILV